MYFYDRNTTRVSCFLFLGQTLLVQADLWKCYMLEVVYYLFFLTFLCRSLSSIFVWTDIIASSVDIDEYFVNDGLEYISIHCYYMYCIFVLNIWVFISPDTQLRRLGNSNISANKLRVRFFAYLVEKKHKWQRKCLLIPRAEIQLLLPGPFIYLLMVWSDQGHFCQRRST